MATEKLDVGLSVRVVDEAKVNNHQPLKSRKFDFKNLPIILCGLGLFIILLSISRIPYLGSYIDSYVFEFLFGYAKYIIYAYLITFLVLYLLRVKFVKKMVSKRFLTALLLIMVSVILILSVLDALYDGRDNNFIDQINFFMKQFNIFASHQTYQYFFPNFFSGGIFSQAFIGIWKYVTVVLIIFIAIIVFISAIFMFINKSRFSLWQQVKKWLIKILGGNVDEGVYGELKPESGDVKPTVYLKAEIEYEGLKIDQETPPLNFLTDTSINNYFESKKDCEKYKIIINKFLHNINIKANYTKTTIMPLFSELTFALEDKGQIDEILRKQQDLLKDLKIEMFNITFKEHDVNFEIPLLAPSKISIKSVLTSLTKIEPHKAIVGIDFENAPLLLDIDRWPRTIIIGKKGSGGAMLISNVICSLAYINTPQAMEFIVLSPLGEKSIKHFDGLPHLRYPVVDDLNECQSKLIDIKNEIEKRGQMFEASGAVNLNEYNKYQKNELTHLKRVVLFVSSFDKILSVGLQNIELLSYILKEGPHVGFNVILLSTDVNNEILEPLIYEQMDAKFILKLQTQNESLRMFDNYRGIQLYGNGDGYFFDVKADKRSRFQACYMNADELGQIINTIQTFYSIKAN